MNDNLVSCYSRLPVAFTRGNGVNLIDEQGREYLDTMAGIAVCALGHVHPAVTEAVSDQASRLIHTSNVVRIPLQEELAVKLSALSGMDRCFFCNSGTEANEAALKAVRLHAAARGVQQPLVIVADKAFHGRTLGAVSTAGDKRHPDLAPLLPWFVQVPYNDIGALQDLASNPSVVAVLLEPIQGEAGVLVPDAGYLSQVRRLCDEHNWLLMLDEVQTGLCRTGRWFAFQHEDAQPDVLTLAKALGNGVPIGACLMSETVAEALAPGTHGSTFGGNPLAARVALAVLQVMEEMHLADHAERMGKHLMSGLTAALSGRPEVRDIRGRGLMIGVELDRDCRDSVMLSALKHRALVNVASQRVIRLLPPLIITEAECDRIVSVISDILDDI